MTSPMTRARADQGTRDRILDTAAALFRRDSTSSFTLTELADRIGLHYTALYHYFASRADLDVELIERHLDRRSERITGITREPKTGLEQVVQFIDAEMAQPPTSLLAKHFDVFSDPHKARVHRAFARNVREVSRIVRRGIADGSIRQLRPHLVSSLIVRILNRYANQNEQVLAQTGLGSDALAGEIADFVSHGVLSPAARVGRIPQGPFRPFPGMQTSGSNLDLVLTTLIGTLNDRGYDSTSIPEVAAGVGLSKTAFYRFARSKEALLYLAVQRSLGLRTQVQMLSRAIGRNALETLLHIVYYGRYLLEHPPGPTLRAATFEFLSKEHTRVAWDLHTAIRFDTIDLLRDGIRQGLFRKVDAQAIQPMLTAAMNIPHEKETGADGAFADQVVDILLHGIAGVRKTDPE